MRLGFLAILILSVPVQAASIELNKRYTETILRFVDQFEVGEYEGEPLKKRWFSEKWKPWKNKICELSVRLNDTKGMLSLTVVATVFDQGRLPIRAGAIFTFLNYYPGYQIEELSIEEDRVLFEYSHEWDEGRARLLLEESGDGLFVHLREVSDKGVVDEVQCRALKAISESSRFPDR